MSHCLPVAVWEDVQSGRRVHGVGVAGLSVVCEGDMDMKSRQITYTSTVLFSRDCTYLQVLCVGRLTEW